MKYFFKYIALILCINHSTVAQLMDSLQNELNQSKTDTNKISILIELAYGSNNLPDQLDYSRQAYEIGLASNSVQYRGRSAITLGLFYSEIDLDSGVALIQKSADEYLSSGIYDLAANAYQLKAMTFEEQNEIDSAISNFKKCFEIGTQNDEFIYAGDAAYSMAGILNVRGRNIEAMEWSVKAKASFEKAEDLPSIAETLNQTGIIYYQKGLYSEAIDSYLKALELSVSIGEVNTEVKINNNLGVVYDDMNNAEMSLAFYNDALEKSKIHDMANIEATLLNNLSYIYLKKEDTARAEKLLKESLSIEFVEPNPCFEGYPLEGLGSIFISQKKLDSAEIILNRALKNGQTCGDVAVMTAVYKNLGKLEIIRKNYKKAENALRTSLALSESAGLLNDKKEALKELYRLYHKQKNTALAMQFLKKYADFSDSLSTVTNYEKAAELAAAYEFRKEVTRIEEERSASKRKLTEELNQKSKENRLILLALILFILLAISLARSFYSIRKRNNRLRWLDNEKNKLMGMVAHDLRNPLNMIIGLVPLFDDVASKKKDDELIQYAELLKASSERMRSMIDRTLDLSEIENMKVNLKKEKTDLTKLTLSTANSFGMIAAKKEIEIITEIDQSKELFAHVDPDYLTQVIENLLTNAIKFSDSKSTVSVSIFSDDEYHTIAVTDQGPGISKEDQRNLFKAYTKLSSKPTGQERSTGLGLSIAHKFVESMNGKISCESKLGVGTTFKVSFAPF
ncbi:MAG: tetratricopeptide repeat protein [Ekhidna sp.]|nr:tetratricopeptide repeat protein [Ekhidna sp.]